jgi:cytochrome P450
VARQLLSPMFGPTSLFMAEGTDWKWQRRAVAPTFRHEFYRWESNYWRVITNH